MTILRAGRGRPFSANKFNKLEPLGGSNGTGKMGGRWPSVVMEDAMHYKSLALAAAVLLCASPSLAYAQAGGSSSGGGSTGASTSAGSAQGSGAGGGNAAGSAGAPGATTGQSTTPPSSATPGAGTPDTGAPGLPTPAPAPGQSPPPPGSNSATGSSPGGPIDRGTPLQQRAPGSEASTSPSAGGPRGRCGPLPPDSTVGSGRWAGDTTIGGTPRIAVDPNVPRVSPDRSARADNNSRC